MYTQLQNSFRRLAVRERETEVEPRDVCEDEKESDTVVDNLVKISGDSPNCIPDENALHQPENPNGCICTNCSALLAKLSECDICMNPLQNSGVSACSRCGGLWCGMCARRMLKCPYCRAPPPKGPCAALARLLRDLSLPCRNQRWGCVSQLTAESRLAHEAACIFGQIICPVDASCGICLPMSSLGSHIHSAHKITAINSGRVNIVIERFETKMMRTAMTRNKYKICLLTHGNAFIVKISLFNFSLHVSIIMKQLKHEVEDTSVAAAKESFCALVEFHSRSISNKSTLIIDKKSYSKKILIQRSDYPIRSWPGENVHIFVTINPLATQEQFVLLL